MAFNMGTICRVCLSNLSSRRYSNLFFTTDRPNHMWSKLMACAWVQVFEGDGLPANICHKCQEKLEVSYQFKQLCESSDAKLRQLLGRSVNTKTVPETRDCAFDVRFMPAPETRGDLQQTDLALNTYRMFNHDVNLIQNMDLRVNFESCDSKDDLSFNPMQLHQQSALKSESVVNENDAILNNIHAKLFEAVSEVVSDALQHPLDLIDTRDMAWDLQNKQPAIAEKNIDNNIIDKAINRNINCTQMNSDKHTHIAEKSFHNDLKMICHYKTNTIPEKNITEMNAFNENSDLAHNHVEDITNDVQIQEFVIDKRLDNIVQAKKGNEMNCDSNLLRIKSSKKSTNESLNGKKKSKEREQCELCGKTFTRSYLQIHARTHNQERPFNCNLCKQTFTMKHILISHMRLHTGEKPFDCQQCGKSFTQSSSLKAHMRLHSGDKPYKCDICTKSFAQKSNLVSHKQTHTNTGHFVCKICDKIFKNNRHLVSHQKLHTQVKNFKCSICEKAFARKSCLRRHMNIHTGERPYKCAWCPMRFPSASSRRKHDFRHRHRLLFKCQICKKSFAQPSGRNRHMRKNHKITHIQTNDE